MKFCKIIMVIALNLLLLPQAHALRPDFESVRKFHDQEIDQLLKDYTLEESITVRAELKRKDGELKDQQIVDIPGLYQKTGEADERGIESVLNLYERKFVFIKKREIGEKEIELVKAALTERLYLPKDTIFTTIDNMATLDDAVKNIKTDFLFGAYTTLIKGGQFLWILIFSIGFIIALWILAKVWKTKSTPGEGGGGAGSGSSIGGSGDNNSKSENNIKADDLGFEKDLKVDSKNSQAFETLYFDSLCRNLNECFEISPGSTSHTMWQIFPDLTTQIQFLEIIKVQNQVPDEIRNKTYIVLDKIFDFKTRASKSYVKRKTKGITKDGLANLSIDLARQRFITPNDALEKCYLSIYPSKADDVDLLIEKSYDEHYVVLYKMFKDYFMTYISALNDDSIMYKINSLLTFEPCGDHAPDAKYKAFYEYANKLNFNQSNESKKLLVNPKMVQMIFSMAESELTKIEAMRSNEDLKSEIPNFNWIDLDDAKNLKEFFSNLSGPEIKYLIEYDPKYNEALNKFDERAQFRFKERMTKEADLSLNWNEFRNKIKKIFKYKPAGQSDPSVKKAS